MTGKRGRGLDERSRRAAIENGAGRHPEEVELSSELLIPLVKYTSY